MEKLQKINELIPRLEKLFEKEDLFYSRELNKVDETGNVKYCEFCISDIPLEESYERQICLGVADEPYPFKLINFDWEDPEKEYFKTIVINDFKENEDILFTFLLAFLEEYMTAKVWIEDDWFYTLEDLKNTRDHY
ncbi:hypothetical protein [Paenibacillus tundrae]|uniref:Uncharacterized protein n=1 Tax=Paenibacillus tundrae TaxID=528187 RepID=A0ABT9WFB3_9BACL|nr:hypothetical protein [Paenibacillus tundrae]MDQ0171830.1 hypothetical protein [Paenibacillus tundrae]